jgi:hypothetical protein
VYPLFFRIIENKYPVGLIYNMIIGGLMNIVVLPLTNVPKQPATTHFSLSAIIFGFAALFICAGLPVSIMADKTRRKNMLTKTISDRFGNFLKVVKANP